MQENAETAEYQQWHGGHKTVCQCIRLTFFFDVDVYLGWVSRTSISPLAAAPAITQHKNRWMVLYSQQPRSAESRWHEKAACSRCHAVNKIQVTRIAAGGCKAHAEQQTLQDRDSLLWLEFYHMCGFVQSKWSHYGHPQWWSNQTSSHLGYHCLCFHHPKQIHAACPYCHNPSDSSWLWTCTQSQ